MKILILGKVWPEPISSAAGKRMLQLINILQKVGEIHFYSTASKTGFETDLSDFTITEKQIELNNDLFDFELKNLNPQIVVFDRFMTEEQFGWRVIENCPDALRILNTEDLHFLRKARGEAIKNKAEIDFDSNDTMRELASIYRCDLSLLVSHVEIDLLLSTFQIPAHLLYYLPLFSEGKIPDIPSFEERKDLVFIGNFLHEPNLDAVKYLSQEIWPILRAHRKDINVTVFGAYPTQQIKELNDAKNGFLIYGRTMNAQEVSKKARISIAPLRFGAGIKGKLLEAMECGTPSITSSIGAEGIALSNEWPGMICSEPTDFVTAILKIYDNQNLWTEKQNLGFEILENRFNLSIYIDDFLNKTSNLMENLDAHRNFSFTGKILIHQSMMSTKYLSKWIIEKNTKK